MQTAWAPMSITVVALANSLASEGRR